MARAARCAGHPVPRPDALGAVLVTAGVGALTLGLVQGGDWGWGSPDDRGPGRLGRAARRVRAALRAASNPLIEPALFRARSYLGATAVDLFSMAFGAMLLSIVLWLQDDWGWSALRTGLGVAPGPVMVPLFSFLIAGRLIARFGPAWSSPPGRRVRLRGDLVGPGHRPEARLPGSVLGGMLLTGAGVGLTLPTLMATAAGSLPPTRSPPARPSST